MDSCLIHIYHTQINHTQNSRIMQEIMTKVEKYF